PKYLNDETPEAWREWLLAINDSLDEEVDETHYHKPGVQKILTSIQKNTLTPEDLARMKDEYSEEILRREEWDKAEKQGRAKGQEEGRKEGREEGAKTKTLDIARQLLDVLDDHTIARKTGLTVKEVAQLRLESQ
ncbi:MAG: hypothetical protein CR991_01320, partial [Proteobacteria bacterium]